MQISKKICAICLLLSMLSSSLVQALDLSLNTQTQKKIIKKHKPVKHKKHKNKKPKKSKKTGATMQVGPQGAQGPQGVQGPQGESVPTVTQSVPNPQTLTPIGGVCSTDQDCQSGNCQTDQCVAKFSDGQSCSADSECSSNYCAAVNNNNICATSCSSSSDCNSGNSCINNICTAASTGGSSGGGVSQNEWTGLLVATGTVGAVILAKIIWDWRKSASPEKVKEIDTALQSGNKEEVVRTINNVATKDPGLNKALGGRRLLVTPEQTVKLEDVTGQQELPTGKTENVSKALVPVDQRIVAPGLPAGETGGKKPVPIELPLPKPANVETPVSVSPAKVRFANEAQAKDAAKTVPAAQKIKEQHLQEKSVPGSISLPSKNEIITLAKDPELAMHWIIHNAWSESDTPTILEWLVEGFAQANPADLQKAFNLDSVNKILKLFVDAPATYKPLMEFINNQFPDIFKQSVSQYLAEKPVNTYITEDILKSFNEVSPNIVAEVINNTPALLNNLNLSADSLASLGLSSISEPLFRQPVAPEALQSNLVGIGSGGQEDQPLGLE